jgi:hypothetical protein
MRQRKGPTRLCEGEDFMLNFDFIYVFNPGWFKKFRVKHYFFTVNEVTAQIMYDKNCKEWSIKQIVHI